MKLSVSILKADSVHLFHLQLYFFSQWNTRIEVYAVYRWAVAFFRFFDLFCWSVIITSIRGSIHEGHEAFSEHSRGRQPSYSWKHSRSFVPSIDGWPTENKARSLHHKPISSFFTLTKHKPKEPTLKPKNDIASHYLLYVFLTFKVHVTMFYPLKFPLSYLHTNTLLTAALTSQWEPLVW